MNTTVLRTAFQVTRAGVRALNDYRQRKAVEAYDALADAASATNQFHEAADPMADGSDDLCDLYRTDHPTV